MNSFKELYETHRNDDFLDEDGYPTDVALKLIEMWPYEHEIQWFEFIKNIWYFSDVAWEQVKHDGTTNLYVSTMGWSGNEAIIAAMMKNDMLWHWTWEASSRGGNFVFTIGNNS